MRKMEKKYVGAKVDIKTYQRLIDLSAKRSMQLGKRVSISCILKEAIQKYLEGGDEKK